MTLEEILQRIGGYVDQDAATPTGTDLTTRINYVNRALDEWAAATDWQDLVETHTPAVNYSATSIGLPSNFKRLRSPYYDESVTPARDYIEIEPEQRYSKDSQDKYVIVRGNRSSGFYIEINPPLASGVSLTAEYYSYPSALATLSDTAVVPNPDYLVTRAIGYVLEARSDPRFPQVKADADRLLFAMIEDEQAPTGGENNRVPDLYRSSKFRIGRD